MPYCVNQTTIQVFHDPHGPSVYIVSHPHLKAPLHIDPNNPGFLSSIDRDSYNFAFAHIEHIIWHDLHSALIEELGLTADHAESIAEAWDAWAGGSAPCHTVAPIACA